MKYAMNSLRRRVALGFAALLVLSAPVAQAATEITFFHNDLLGSPVAATDETGAIKWREGYHPYGARTNVEPEAERHDLWYTGKTEDAESGLVYLNARYYDSEAGRFMAIDPIGFRADSIHSWGRYTYVNNNPYRYTDPSGNIPVETFADGAEVLLSAGRVFGATGAFFWGVATNNQALQNVAVKGLEDLQTDMVLATAALVTPYVSSATYSAVDATKMTMQMAKSKKKPLREWFNGAVLALEIAVAAANYGYTSDVGASDIDFQLDDPATTQIEKREGRDPPKKRVKPKPGWWNRFNIKRKKGHNKRVQDLF